MVNQNTFNKIIMREITTFPKNDFFSIFNRSSTTHRNSLCIGILYCAKLAQKLSISNVNLGPNNLNKVYLSLIDTCCIFNNIWNSRPHACSVATENVIPTENVIHYIFGYYIFGCDRPTENVITENVIKSVTYDFYTVDGQV